MRLLLTRPRSVDDALPALLVAAGHAILKDPLLAIEPVPLTGLATDDVVAVIASSANALAVCGEGQPLDTLRRLPVFTVGEGTARMANRLGFADIRTGPGTAAGLVPLVLSAADLCSGPLLYLRGEDVAFDLAPPLLQAGCTLREAIVYRAVEATQFSATVRDAIRHGEVDAVVLMSPRTSKVYVRLIQSGGLVGAASRVLHVCLSENVAAPLAGLGTVPQQVAEAPTVQALLTLIAQSEGKNST